MILKRRVSLNGINLDELDNRILITGIDEAAGKESITAAGVAGRSGQRITARRRDTLDVTVKFTMNIRNDKMTERALLLEKVNTWARAGGRLRVNYRPDRRLFVVLAQAPGNGDLFNWANEFSLVFRAYQVPYWTDETETAMSTTVSTGAGFKIEVPGSAETVADFVVTNGSGAMVTWVNLQIGASAMRFEGNDLLPAGQTITIDHPENIGGLNYIRAVNNAGSVLKYRTGANDFYCSPGENQVSFTSSRAVKILVKIRGRYL